MDKKIYGYSIYGVIVLWMFGIVFQMSAMQDLENTTVQAPENIKEEFRVLVDAELPTLASSISKEEGEILKKDIAEAKKIAIETIIRKNVEDGKKDLKAIGEIYLYDEKTGKGSIFEVELIPMSITLHQLLENVEGVSSSVPIYYSAGTIKIMHDILKECEQFKGTDEYAKNLKNVTDAVSKRFAQFVDVAELVSVFALANHLNIDKAIYNALLNQLKQKVNVIIAGHGWFTDNEKAILDSIDRNLLKIIVTDEWDMFIEKMKIVVAKKYFGDKKENYYKINKQSNNLDPRSDASDVLFSPDGKFLWMKTQWTSSSGMHGHKDYLIINTENRECKNLLKDQNEITFFYGTWIEKNKFLCAHSQDATALNLHFYDCERQELIIEKFDLPPYKDFDNIFLYNALGVGDEIIFFYKVTREENILRYGIAVCNYKNKTIQYSDLKTIPEYSVWDVKIVYKSEDIINFLCFGPTIILYEFDCNTKNLVKVKEFGQEYKVAFTGRDKKLAINVTDDLRLYFLNTKNEIQCSGNRGYVRSLAFSPNGKVLVADQKDQIVFFSAITGGNIGKFEYRNYPYAEYYMTPVFSSDGNKLAVCSQADITDILLLIMKLVPDIYVPIFDYLTNNTFSLNQIIMLTWLQNQSDNGKKPLQLTKEEKATLNEIQNNGFRRLLIDIGYVAPGQISTQPVKTSASVYGSKETQPLKELGKNMLKSGKSYWDWLKANFSWDSLMKYLPQSG